MSFDERLNDVVITAKQLIRSNELAHEGAERARAAGEKVDFLSLVFPIFEEYRNELTPLQITAISFRLQALSSLIVSRSAEKWTLRLQDDEVFIDAAVYAAAARARIDTSGAEPSFDQEEFLQLALDYSYPEGTA